MPGFPLSGNVNNIPVFLLTLCAFFLRVLMIAWDEMNLNTAAQHDGFNRRLKCLNVASSWVL